MTWTLQTILLCCETHKHIQKKSFHLSNYAQHVGLRISQKMTKVIMQNVTNRSPVTASGGDLLASEVFTFFGSTATYDGGAGRDINSCRGKVTNAFRMLINVWKSSQCSTQTNLMMYHSCVVFPLLYGSGC